MKMDDVISRKFKGPGNGHPPGSPHSPKSAPARRATSPLRHAKEELITEPSELSKMWNPCARSDPMDELAAIEFLLERWKATKTNTTYSTR